MITEIKLKIYKKYKGDIDSWARGGLKNEKENIKDNDWFLIDNLIQDIHLVKKGLASKDFERNLIDKLMDECENDNVIDILKSLV